MSEYVPGSPNVGISIPKKYVSDESVIDRRFHHASLVGEDDELASIEQMHEIMPYIWLSSWDIATDMNMLRDRRIKFVLNLGPTRKDRPTLEAMMRIGIQHEHYAVENVPDWTPTADTSAVASPSERVVVGEATTRVAEAPVQIMNLRQALPMAAGFIKRAFDLKCAILVHDDQGTSAAPAAVAYFLLKTFYDKAKPTENKLKLVINRIKAKRPCVDINFGFIEYLEDFEAAWSGRAVLEQHSLSIRRNPVLKASETARIRRVTSDERAAADQDWARRAKADGARGTRKKL